MAEVEGEEVAQEVVQEEPWRVRNAELRSKVELHELIDE